MSVTDTFESLILEAKEAGGVWVRDNELEQITRTVHCRDGRCVLGAVIFKRFGNQPVKLSAGFSMPAADLATPIPFEAAPVLEISNDLARRIALANDGINPDDARLLDQLLGIWQERQEVS